MARKNQRKICPKALNLVYNVFKQFIAVKLNNGNNGNKEYSGPFILMMLGVMGLVALIIFSAYQGYMYLAEDVFNWDQRSTFTVGLSILLLLYGLLFFRSVKSTKKKDGNEELTEKEQAQEKMRSVSTLGIIAVMIFLFGWILFKNKEIWNIPGEVGLGLIASSCLFLIAADYLQYKLTAKKAYLILIPMWLVVFGIFVTQIFTGHEGLF